MTKGFCAAGILGCLLALVAAPASAQITSTIHGVVRDANQAVLPGATVRVESPALKRTGVSAITDPEGRYRLVGLPPGVYTVTVELQGFATATRPNITLELNTDLPVDVTLQLARLEETVTVSAEAPMVRTRESDLSVQIDTRAIDSIPLNGRQFLDLVALAPGTAARPQQSDQGANITVFGERSITSSFLVDGLDNNDLFSRDFSEFFIQDAIQEFKVLLAGYQAEFGKASGAVANVVTRSGSNLLTGRAFMYYRDSALDSSNISGQDAPQLNRVETGGTIGGPIKKDHSFFFDAFQFFREKRGLNFDQSVIPPIISDGYFTPSIGQEPFDKAPLDKRYTNFVRFDQQLNERNQLFITSNLNWSSSVNYIPRPDRGFAAPPPGTLVLPSISSDLDIDTGSVNGRYTTFLNPNTILESSARYSRYSYAENDAKPKGAEQLFPITFAPAFFIWMSNASPIGQLDRKENRFQWTENLSYFKGGHNIKAGLDIDRTHLDNYFLSANEIIIGNTLLDTNYKTLGYDVSMQRFISPIVSSNDHANATNTNISFFGQDSWQVGPNLTLNLGLRYDYATLFSDDKSNISPRLGFSYDVGGNGRTVVRGGLGRFYDQTILEAVVQTPELGGVQYGSFDMQIIPRGGSLYNNPAIGAYGPLQDSGTRWLSNPLFYSYLIPANDTRTSGGITITGKGQPYIVYDLLGIPVPDPKNPPVLSYSSIPKLTGGKLTPQQALNILNTAFPGPTGPQFDFLPETGANSINTGQPLLFKFRQLQQEVSTIQTVQHPEQTPYTDSLNLGVERALAGDISVDAEVFIRRSRDLLARRVINLLPVPVSGSCAGNTVNQGPCNQQLQYIGFLDTNALTVSLRKRFSHRYAFLANYTYTDAIDNFSTLRVPPAAGETSFLFNSDPRIDIGRSLNAPVHVFVLSGVYQLPYQIDLSGVFRADSGRPFNAAGLPQDSDGDTQFDNRLIGTPKGGFLTDIFVQLDMRVAKEIRFGGRQRLTALMEIFNVFNRANPFVVNNTVGPSLGQTIQPYPGREIQLGLRLDF